MKNTRPLAVLALLRWRHLAALSLLAAQGAVALAVSPAQAQTKRQADRAPPACIAEKWPLPAAAWGEAFAIDGDTLAIAGLKPHLRIWGIQAAELRGKPAPGATGIETAAGMRARAALEDLLAAAPERKVWFEPAKWDRYCRIVGLTFTEPGEPKGARTDLGLALLQQGMAYGFWLDDTIKGSPELGRVYAAAEAKARRDRRGLWPEWLGEK